MASASSRVIINRMKIAQLNKAAIMALEETGEAVQTDVMQKQVVPFDVGTLQGDGMWVDYSNSSKGIVEIVHSTPYARRMYFHPEYNFQTHENPHARGEWFEDWISGKRANYAHKVFAKIYKGIAGL